MEEQLSALSLDTITELKPVKVTFLSGVFHVYFHNPADDAIYFLRRGQSRASLFGVPQTRTLPAEELIPKGTLSGLEGVVATSFLSMTTPVGSINRW
jgi:hypothetical protein